MPYYPPASSVAGSDTEVQYNDNGSLGASSNLTYDYTNSKLTIKALNDLATLSSEQITTTDFTNVAWTSTGWTTTTTTATHNSGNTSALSTSQFSITAGLYYQITWTVSSASSTDFTTITPKIGSASGRAMTGNGTFTQIILATGTTPSLSFTPTSTYVGVISAVSVKEITASSPLFNGTSSGNLSQFDLRTHAVATAQANLGIGIDAHMFHTGTGARNVALGGQTLRNNTTGNLSMAIGFQSLGNQTTGSRNVAIGNQAAYGNVNGGYNTAIGTIALTSANASYNTGIGDSALRSVTFGAYNVGIGYQSGYTATSGNALTTGSNNLFLGYNTGLGSSTQRSNASAIGSQAVVDADNALVLGSISGTNGATSSVNVGISLSSPTFRLSLPSGTTSAEGIGFGTDTVLYRSAADTLNLGDGDGLNVLNSSSKKTVSLSSSGIQLFGTDQTFTSASPSGVSLTNSYTIDYSNGSIPTFSYSGATISAKQSLNTYLGGFFVWINNTIKNVNAVTANLGSQTGFIETTTFQADGASISMPASTGFASQPTMGVINSGTLAVNSLYGFYSGGTVNSGVTVSYRKGLSVADITGTGTVTEQCGVDVDALTKGTTNIGVRIAKANTYSLQLSDTGGTSAGGITFGTDTNLYRNTANSLKTDDSFSVGGSLNLNGTFFNLSNTGVINIGDTNLYRGSANTIKSDDKFDANSYAVAGTNGASGSFTTADSKTVTVTSGIITSIV